MRLTQVLAIRNLIAKLHPPLPPTPRESQHLLSVLQKSFNQRLDDTHPSPHIHSSPRNHSTADQLPDIRNVSAGAANAHLEAILQHPSLEQPASPFKLADLFDAAILAESVNFSFIRSCVDAAKKVPVGRYEAALELGRRISTWFTTLDSATKKAFLSDNELMSRVVPLLYQGRLEGTVWDWLRTLYDISAEQQEPSILKTEDYFVALMTRESVRRNNAAAAVFEYVEACEYRSSRSSHKPLPADGAFTPLPFTHNLISSAVRLRRHKHGISGPLYDRLLSYVDTRGQSPLWPLLHIYHPIAPNSRPLYRSLRNASYAESLMLKVRTMKHDRATKMLVNILDGAEVMLAKGAKEDAEFILDFAQENFDSMLPSKRPVDIGELIHEARKYVTVHRSTEGVTIT